jgi:acyl-CoA synthetase (NDP forming)
MTTDPCLQAELERAFHPKAVAIVGVSRDDVNPPPGYTGLKILRLLLAAGFEGHLYPINPRATTLADIRAYPSIRSVPEPLDLVIVTIPAQGVPQVLEDCVASGAVNVHICSAGFGETGEAEGKVIEDKVRQIAAKEHLRIVGPNCLGYHVPAARLNMYQEVRLLQGPVAFLSQSGGHAQDYVGYGPALGIGFSKVVSYGNALMMDCTDFLEYLATDAETQIICLYLEGVKDGRKLMELVREISRTKPIIVWKGGLTALGARAAVTHTASLAGDGRIWTAFFKQTGAVPVGSIEEMADTAMTFLRLKPLLRARAAVIVGGGGSNVANGDICAQEGIEVPALSGETRTRLLKLLSLVNQSVVNPIDSPGVLYDSSLLWQVLETLTADPSVDLVILHISTFFRTRATAEAKAKFKKCVTDFCSQYPSKPVVVAVRGSDRMGGEAELTIREMREADITTYSSLRAACRALKGFMGYHMFNALLSEEVSIAGDESDGRL